MGHDVIGMEQYVAEGGKPVDRCVADVTVSDLYVMILGWRYGYVPGGINGDRSITELELEAAKQAERPILAFLADPESPWAPSDMDAYSADLRAASGIARLRSEVGVSYLAGIFRGADDLATQVAAAVARHGLRTQLVERLLAQSSVRAEEMGGFGGGSALYDTNVASIKQMVHEAGRVCALVVDLGNGDQWWSTRLFLLASLLKALTAVRQLVFRLNDGSFGGMATPCAVVDGLAARFVELDSVRREIASGGTQDTENEIDRQIRIWNHLVRSEQALKVGVRAELLPGWLGERLVGRCITVDETGLNMSQVQQIVDSLLPDVPLERRVQQAGTEKRTVELQVVDRDAFALELARAWIRSGLPRSPVQ